MKKNKQLLDIMNDLPEEFVVESNPSKTDTITVKSRISRRKIIVAAAYIAVLLGFQYYFLIKPLYDINQENTGNSITNYYTTLDNESSEMDKSNTEKDYPYVQNKKLYNGEGIFRPTELCTDGTIFGRLSVLSDSKTFLAGVDQSGETVFLQDISDSDFDGLLSISSMCQKYSNGTTYLLETDGQLDGDYSSINEHIIITREVPLAQTQGTYYEPIRFSDFESERFYPVFSNIEATENGDFYIAAFCNEEIYDKSEQTSLKSLGYCKFYKYDSAEDKVISLKFNYENSFDADITTVSGKIFISDEKLYCIIVMSDDDSDGFSVQNLCYQIDFEKGECLKVPLPENMQGTFFPQRDGTVSYIADRTLYSYSVNDGEIKKVFDLNDYYAFSDMLLKVNNFEYISHSAVSSYALLVKNAQTNAAEEFVQETDNNENITMYITEDSNAGTGVSIAVLNANDREVLCGQDYRLQVEKDGKWYILEPWTNDPDEPVFCFTSEAIRCKKEEPVTFTLDWTYFYGGALPDGHYRVCKPFQYEVTDTEYFYLTAEFDVKNTQVTAPAWR